MTNQIGDVSDDGFWVLTESGWQPTEAQKQAINQGARPYSEVEEETINMGLETQANSPINNSNQILSFAAIGLLCLGLLMQIIGMHLDSWTGVSDDEDEGWPDADGGMGLTEFTIDCSDVTGIDDEFEIKNKDLCKFGAGLFSGDISVQEAFIAVTAEDVEELTDDLPDEISGSISKMCDVQKDISDDSSDAKEDIEKCEDRDSAGGVAIALYWVSFSFGLIALITGLLGIFTATPYADAVSNSTTVVCVLLSITAFFCWLIMTPELNDDISYGSGFVISIISMVILISSTALTFIKSWKPSKTTVF